RRVHEKRSDLGMAHRASSCTESQHEECKDLPALQPRSSQIDFDHRDLAVLDAIALGTADPSGGLAPADADRDRQIVKDPGGSSGDRSTSIATPAPSRVGLPRHSYWLRP